MRGRPWTDADMRQASKLYRSGLEIGEIARVMGRRSTFISDKLHENAGNKYGKWTKEDDAKLICMMRDGFSLDQAARNLMRTREAVRQRTIDLECNGLHHLYSSYDLAGHVFLYGVWPKLALGWMKNGILESRNSRCTHDQLIDFLGNPNWWMAWQPDQLADKELREWTTGERASSTWYWMSTDEVASKMYAARGTVIRWCQEGKFRLTARYPTRRWWIRSDDEGLRVR